MRRMLLVIFWFSLMASTGCKTSQSAVRTGPPIPPAMVSSAKSGAERVRLDQMHEMALKDAQARR